MIPDIYGIGNEFSNSAIYIVFLEGEISDKTDMVQDS